MSRVSNLTRKFSPELKTEIPYLTLFQMDLPEWDKGVMNPSVCIDWSFIQFIGFHRIEGSIVLFYSSECWDFTRECSFWCLNMFCTTSHCYNVRNIDSSIWQNHFKRITSPLTYGLLQAGAAGGAMAGTMATSDGHRYPTPT